MENVQLLAWVGGACVVAGFFWMLGLLLGLRLRGERVPLKACCSVIVAVYLVLAGAVLTLALAERGEEAPAEEVAAMLWVDDVIDGDTLDVRSAEGVVRVRIIGIDTPETVDPRRPAECFGAEASAKAEELLAGKVVVLAADASQGDADKYGRALRYVSVNGVDVGLALIEGGFAEEYTYDAPYERQTAYQEAEATAEISGAGMWTACR